MNLKIRKRPPHEAFLKIVFQDPLDENSPVVTTRAISPQEERIEIESPPMRGFRNYHYYVVLVDLYADSSLQDRLGQHAQAMLYSMPKKFEERLRKEGF